MSRIEPRPPNPGPLVERTENAPKHRRERERPSKREDDRKKGREKKDRDGHAKRDDGEPSDGVDVYLSTRRPPEAFQIGMPGCRTGRRCRARGLSATPGVGTTIASSAERGEPMSGSLYVSAAGAEARLTQLDVLADNLANSGTTGFRASTVVFEAVLEAALLDQGDVPGAGRAYVSATQSAIRGAFGPIENTGRDLDAAIQGDGFFVVETPGGSRYTRAGAFRVDPTGFLVSLSGHPVLGDGGPIAAGERPLRIEADGSVVDDQGERVGRLQVVRFEDSAALVKEGSGLLRALQGELGEPLGNPVLATRSLEGSTVQPIQDLARMVIVQRAFDAVMRTLEAEDEASGRLLKGM